MRTTIIIPCWHQEEYMQEAIESALMQTTPCEVICILDGDTPESLRIAKQYEPEIKVVQQVNKGLASARNTGIMNATSEYILPLDADDILLDNCVERLLHLADETKADILAPSIQCFGIGDTQIILKPKPTIDDFRLGNHIGYFSMYKREMALALGGYSPKMVFGYEDMAYWIAALTRGYTIETTPEVLVKYRTKTVSMWKESKEHHLELMMQIYKDFPNFLPS